MSTLTLLAAAAPKDAAGSSAAASATAVAVAVFALVLGLVQWKRKKTPKVVGWLMLIAGAGIAGAAGWAGDFLRKAGELAGTAISAGTASTFGVAIPGAIVAGVGQSKLDESLPALPQGVRDRLAESLGGVESLIEVPQAMTHQSVEGSDAAVPADLVRLSCGIEEPADLVADLRAAIESA